MSAARSNAVSRAQPLAASFAAAIACCASAREPCGTSPICSPVAGESATNVAPPSAAPHAPPTNIPCVATLDATRAHVLEHDPHQIPDRDDPAWTAILEHRQMPEPAVDHHDGRLLRRLVRVDR